ncbi:MAG TPA: HAMP domain-containing sensor histidine kinase [Pricia sp.]|nr:HAMP domain-containing sensor histidine kinase [Pricia sp.]
MLTRRKLFLVVFAISAIGLLIVQYQYLKIGLGLAGAQFSKKIDMARTNITKELSEYNSLTYSIGRTIDKDTSNLAIGLDSLRGMTQYFLDDYLRYQLGVSGIDAPFSYVLYARDSTTYLTSPAAHIKNDDIRLYPIKIEGYLARRLEKELVLELGFKDINTYFLYQLNGLTIPGLVFLLAIIAVVVWVLKSFYWQSTLITTTNEFINNLTHELKTPVFSIAIATKILEEGMNPEKKPILNVVKRETGRLKMHIEKVLELGSLESGKAILQFSEIDFRPELQRICEDFDILSEHEGIDFGYKLAEGTYPVLAETFHLENAISNLLDNARKYSESPKIRLDARTIGRQVHIAITDNGPGIAKNDLRRVFRKYYRVKNDAGHRVKGYGLGLTYVQRIIRMHGGKVEVESELGKGTTFTIILNLIKKSNYA